MNFFYKLCFSVLLFITLLTSVHIVLAAPAAPTPAPVLTNDIEFVNVNYTGDSKGDAYVESSSISTNGNYIAFSSYATDIVTGDSNAVADIFVRDMNGETNTRVSVDSIGTQSDNNSYYPDISGDGRYVVFQSSATNLVANDGNIVSDIFLHDTQTGATTRVSVDSLGNEANGSSERPRISSDGRYIVFHSMATNLVAGDTNLGVSDIFLHDTQTGATTRVSVDSLGNEANENSYYPDISGDGRYIVFASYATNLVTGDTNGFYDIFLHDTQTGATTRVSIGTSLNEGNGNSEYSRISSDGAYVVFQSYADNFAASDVNGALDIFRHTIGTGGTVRMNIDDNGQEANSDGYSPDISSDGNLIVFWSYATNLVTGDTNGFRDIFIHNVSEETTRRLTSDSIGRQGNGDSFDPQISGDGDYVSFVSFASNLHELDVSDTQLDLFRVSTSLFTAPIIINTSASSITQTTATLGAEITSAGGDTITSRGMFYVKLSLYNNGNPDDGDVFEVNEVGSFGVGAFSGSVIDLTCGTEYIYAAYAENSIGEVTAHTPLGSFTTSPCTSSGTVILIPSYVAPPVIYQAPSSNANSNQNSNSSNNTSGCTATTTFSPLTGVKCPTSTQSSEPYQFTRSLRLNMIGGDVKKLQEFLNTHDAVIATTGVGSLGKETTLFGKKTMQALIKYQKAHNITPASGFFGAKTMKFVNDILKARN